MSVRTMAKVWDISRHGGSELLILLAIADFADDDGRAYPSVGTLAKKTRMSARNVNHILAALRSSGELEVKQNEGPHGTNRYRIRLEATAPLKPASPLKQPSAPEGGFTPEAPVILKPASSTPEAGFPKPLKPASDEPSLNHQEPSVSSSPANSRQPPCPHRELIALFVERVPELPKPRIELWADSKAAKDLANRWKWVMAAKRENGDRYATTRDEAMAWFGRFFDAVAASDFLTGRDGGWSGCNLQWLIKPGNFPKVVEGNYRNKGAIA